MKVHVGYNRFYHEASDGKIEEIITLPDANFDEVLSTVDPQYKSVHFQESITINFENTIE